MRRVARKVLILNYLCVWGGVLPSMPEIPTAARISWTAESEGVYVYVMGIKVSMFETLCFGCNENAFV